MRFPTVMLLLAALALGGAASAQSQPAKAPAKSKARAAAAKTKAKSKPAPAKASKATAFKPAALDSPSLEAIAGMLTPRPTAFGRPIADRADWDPIAQSAAGRAVIAEAERILTTPMPEQSDDLFLEFTRIGNRVNWEGVARQRRDRVKWLTEAECLENKGRFLPELERTIRTLCAERTWVWPAHDGGLTNFHGTGVTIDLFSSTFANVLGTADVLLGDKLSPELRALVREKVAQRIFTPYKRMLAGQQDRYWLDNPNNWSAVCLANVTGAALSLLDSPRERAFFVKAAMDSSWIFLSGFAPDGYCSEGVGYWNFGFGYYVVLAEEIRLATQGGIDILARKQAYNPATFGARIQLQNGVCPAFADCAINAQPDPELMDLLSRRLGLGLPPYTPDTITAGKGTLFEDMLYLFHRPAPAPASAPFDAGLRSWFSAGGILIARPAQGSACRMAVALKGGHNGEHHNHNDLGSYVVAIGDRPVLLDPGAEVYTKRTFSARRYDSKLLNSFGHPVPVVAGKLQREGGQFQAKVLNTDFTDAKDAVSLDLKSPYAVKDLLTLTRDFAYSRQGAGSLTVTDTVAFAQPETFETALVTFGKWTRSGENALRVEYGGQAVSVAIDTQGAPFELTAEQIKEDLKSHGEGVFGVPTRLGVRLKSPVKKAVVTLTITPAAK